MGCGVSHLENAHGLAATALSPVGGRLRERRPAPAALLAQLRPKLRGSVRVTQLLSRRNATDQ